MRKFLKYKIIGLAFIVMTMVACDQANQEPEPVVSPDSYPVSTVTPEATSVVEGNSLIINITTDKMIDRAITFSFEQTGGTADEEDYSIEPATLQPYTKSVQMVLEAFVDYDITNSETLTGEISVLSIADRYLLNPSTENPVTVSFTIVNAVSAGMEVSFSWGGDVVIGEDTYDAADEIDFDFFIADADGFDPNDVWATYIEYVAASSVNPETFTFEGWPDGSYILLADLWANGMGGLGSDVPIPVSTLFTRQGTSLIDFEITQPEADAMSSDQLGNDDDPSTDFQMVIAKITVAGDKYTIFDAKDTNLGTYKKSGAGVTPRPLNYRR